MAKARKIDGKGLPGVGQKVVIVAEAPDFGSTHNFSKGTIVTIESIRKYSSEEIQLICKGTIDLKSVYAKSGDWRRISPRRRTNVNQTLPIECVRPYIGEKLELI